jgi:two-component system, OmpR family, phosphate regulon sensor histidine kinase PhoR
MAKIAQVKIIIQNIKLLETLGLTLLISFSGFFISTRDFTIGTWFTSNGFSGLGITPASTVSTALFATLLEISNGLVFPDCATKVKVNTERHNTRLSIFLKWRIYSGKNNVIFRYLSKNIPIFTVGIIDNVKTLSENFIKRILILGSLAIVGVIAVQSYWLLKSWDIRDRNFHRSVSIALQKVAQQIANKNKAVLPKYQLIQRRSSNVYVVNVNSKIKDFNMLERLLNDEMENVFINTDFEYAVYDCASSEMIYGNYVKMDGSSKKKKKSDLPKFTHLDYYFVVKFPERESYIVNNLWTSILLGSVAILSVLFFTYSILIILRQKRLSDLQKDFINNMTHEFKTPIASIKIAADVIQKEESIKHDPRLMRYATIIKDQNTRLNDQVEKVLNVARLENETLTLHKVSIRLDDLLSSAIDANEIKLEKGTIKLHKEIEKVLISADKLHLTNVLYNMLDNAVKYCQTVPEINITMKPKNQGVVVAISDNGIGISEENLKYLFDKFYRVNTGNVHNVKGFGLGLFYVKSICKAHGWDITVQSTSGVGSTFEIYIPTFKHY